MLDKYDKTQESEPEESDDLNDLDTTITENDKIIDKKLYKKYFKYDSLGNMQEDLYMTEWRKAHPQKRLQWNYSGID